MGRLKLQGKEIKWGRREREGGKGIKNKRDREKKGRKGEGRKKRKDRTRLRRYQNVEKMAKMKTKGERKVRAGSLDILFHFQQN